MALSNPRPPKFTPYSSNKFVRELIADYLQCIDPEITSEQAEELAGKFYGMGSHALETDQETWEGMFGKENGKLVYEEFVCLRGDLQEEREPSRHASATTSGGFGAFSSSLMMGKQYSTEKSSGSVKPSTSPSLHTDSSTAPSPQHHSIQPRQSPPPSAQIDQREPSKDPGSQRWDMEGRRRHYCWSGKGS